MAGPQFLGYPTLLGEPQPSKWERLKQALWETNLNAPIRGAYNLMNTPYDVLMGADSPAKEQAVADSFDAAGGVMVGSMPMPKPANSLTMGIKAYHGSPHSFDKFSMDKIGTGEGAQAYGHGLYFAENEGVAKGYRDHVFADPDGAFFKSKTGKQIATDQLRSFGAQPDALKLATEDLNNSLLTARFKSKLFQSPEMDERVQGLEEAISYLETKVKPGSMYEVSIDADPNAFLDWDKPLSEQPDVLSKLNGVDPSVTGDVLHQKMFHAARKEAGGNQGSGVYQEAVRKKLNEAGIPGIKYLDAGSRGAGDGTRNYVVFDDKLISIVRKYGIAGASAMLGYDVLTGANDAQAKAVKKADLDHTWDNWLKSGGI